ncbi:MAG TPA: hypothetical protein VKE74_26900 [Gemmataceae bacterium]|nr:hypothetical protein [Gemmataceae bacterium]
MTPDPRDASPEKPPPTATDDTTDFSLRSEDAEPGLNVLDDEDPVPDATDILPAPDRGE